MPKLKKNRTFSDKEIQVISFIASDLRVSEIADRMDLSTRAIEHHIHNLKVKTGARTQAGIVMYSILNNVLVINN